MAKVINPYPQFFDIDGEPLESGFIYIGQSGLDPEVNPITVYTDSNLTVPIVQPIRTLAGLPVSSGTPVQLFTSENNFSITVRNKNGTLVRSALSSTAELFIPSMPTFSTLADAVTGTTFDGTVIDYALLTNNGALKVDVQTQVNNTSSNTGGARYLAMSEAQAIADGHTIDGNGVTGGNHYVGGGTDYVIILQYDEELKLDWFGTNGTRAQDSLAIRAAVVFDLGVPIRLEEKRYFYDGTVISDSPIRIWGSGMPQVNAGRTALENGSIIDGTFPFTSSDLDFRDFGVDNGSDSSATDGDALRTTAPLNAGGHLHTENIVGLCASPSTTGHALLFQSHLKHTGGNLLGVYSLFGFVTKCQNVDLGLIYTIENDESGVLLKSDLGFGANNDVSIDQVVTEGSANQKRGFHVQSSEVTLRQVQVGKIRAEGAIDNVLIQLGSAGPDIRNLQIGDIISRNSQSTDVLIDTTSSTGIIWNVEINSILSEGTLGNGIVALGNGDIRDLNINYAFINHDASATDTQLEESCFIGGACVRTNIGALTILRNFSAALLGGIRYSNPVPDGSNSLGARHARVYGAGAFDTGYAAYNVNGANQAITIPFNRGGDPMTYVGITPDNATGDSIDTFDNEYLGITGYAAEPFRRGYILTLQNTSANQLTIVHNPGGKVRTTGGVNQVVAGQDTLAFVWNGTLWAQI